MIAVDFFEYMYFNQQYIVFIKTSYFRDTTDHFVSNSSMYNESKPLLSSYVITINN